MEVLLGLFMMGLIGGFFIILLGSLFRMVGGGGKKHNTVALHPPLTDINQSNYCPHCGQPLQPSRS